MNDFRSEVIDSISILRKKYGLDCYQAFRELTRVFEDFTDYWMSDLVSKSDLQTWQETIREEERAKILKRLGQ